MCPEPSTYRQRRGLGQSEGRHKCRVEGQGTRDLCGPEGLTTEQFVEVVAKRLNGAQPQPTTAPQLTT